jgi:hypothetical protein
MNNKFEDGVLTVTGCMQRHTISRNEADRTRHEDYRDTSFFGNHACKSEMHNLAYAHRLIAKGLRPDPSIELEDWIARYKELLP